MNCNFRLETETAKMPTMHTRNSAGIDFYSDDTLIIGAKDSMNISLGVSWNPRKVILGNDIRLKPSLIIQSRSGLAFKHGIESSNAGVIDADYVSKGDNKATIKVKLYNNSDKAFAVHRGDKICQGVVHLSPFIDDVEILDSDRNGKGFGSSDEKE